MLAVRGYGPHDYRLEEVPIPRAGSEEVVIKVRKAGICASDVHRYAGTHLYWKGMLASQHTIPYIPGHEFVGDVVELGPGASEKYELELGDKAICEQSIPCWGCRFCLSGKYWMCSHKKRRDGAMAEYMRFPQGAIVHRVPDSLPDEVAVMIEPLSCAIHAVRRATIELGDIVVIAGAGAIGLCMLQVTRLKTPDMTIVLDVREDRLEIAREVGADLTINVAEEDPVTKVKELSGDDGCDVFIDSSGSPKAVVDGLAMIRKLGTFVEFAVFEEEVKVDWSIIGDVKEIDIRGAHLSPYCYPLAIKYLQRGLVRVDRIVTHNFPLSKFEEAFELAIARDRGVLKVTLTPGT
jgi:L-iditol 2-dehydrogenase